MAHTTPEQRRQAAKERKRKYLYLDEASLASALKYAADNPFDHWATADVERLTDKLCRAYIEAGYSETEATGMARGAAAGKPGSWIAWAAQPSSMPALDSIQSASSWVQALGTAARWAQIAPHPLLPAIALKVGGTDLCVTAVVNTSILELDALASLLARVGLEVSLPMREDVAGATTKQRTAA